MELNIGCKYSQKSSKTTAKRTLAHVFTETSTVTLLAALFIIANNWKHSGSPSSGEQINNLWAMHVMKYRVTLKKINKTGATCVIMD